jgi:hypothetical protein
MKQFAACSVFARKSPSRADRLNGFHEHAGQVSQHVERIGFQEEQKRRIFHSGECLRDVGFV